MPRKKQVNITIDGDVDVHVSTKDTSMTYLIICDGSGSMANVQSDVIKGLNKILDDAKAEADNSRVWMTTFDVKHKVVFENAKLSELRKLTQKDTFLGGGTALLDAIGETLARAQEHKLVGKKTVVIYTDGQENSSYKWKKEQIHSLIKKLQKKDWTFIFMSADVDNFDEAMSLGIAKGNYMRSTSGTSAGNFYGISHTISQHKLSTNVVADSAFASAGISAQTLSQLQEEADEEE